MVSFFTKQALMRSEGYNSLNMTRTNVDDHTPLKIKIISTPNKKKQTNTANKNKLDKHHKMQYAEQKTMIALLANNQKR